MAFETTQIRSFLHTPRRAMASAAGLAFAVALITVIQGCTRTEASSPDKDGFEAERSVLIGEATLPALAGPSGLDQAWARDTVWDDGLAEEARYAAIRNIYRSPRAFTARIYTNAETYAASTTTKANGNADGPTQMVLKHHARDDVPTEAYTYHFSTMAYVGRDGQTPVKVEMGSNEDCGATFKSLVVDGAGLQWFQSSYFPEEGIDGGRIEVQPDTPLVFHDALTLVLRGFPFESAESLQLRVVPEATTTRWSAVQPVDAEVRFVGRSTLTLPIGSVEAYELAVDYADGQTERYWFHSDPDKQYVLVAADTMTQQLRLQSLKRAAYW